MTTYPKTSLLVCRKKSGVTTCPWQYIGKDAKSTNSLQLIRKMSINSFLFSSKNITKSFANGNVEERANESFVFTTTLIVRSGFKRTLVRLFRPWIRRFTMICGFVASNKQVLGGFEQAANSKGKNSKKSTRTLDHWKLPSRHGFLHKQSYGNEKYRV